MSDKNTAIVIDTDTKENKIQTTISEEEISFLERLMASRKEETLQITDPKKYIKELVFKLYPLFWKNMQESLESEDPKTKRDAMIEYNKLQVRLLPTEISGSDGQQIQINIIGMGVDTPKQKTIDGEVV